MGNTLTTQSRCDVCFRSQVSQVSNGISFIRLINIVKWSPFDDTNGKSRLLFWRVIRWLYIEVILWLSYDHHFETLLWNYHESCIVMSQQMTSQWSHMVIPRRPMYGDSIVKSPWALLCNKWSSDQITSFWCHFGTRHKGTSMVLLQ